MVRIDIPFIVNGQHIKQHPKVKIAAGGQNHFYAVFKICGIWTNISYKKAVFRYDGRNYIMDIVQNGDQMECRIPWEVMTTPNTYFDTGIFGGDRIPTSMARTFVIEGCVGDGQEPQAPTPDWFQKIEEAISRGIMVTGATVGQTVRIAEVDNNGAPTAWEAVEFPSSQYSDLEQLAILIEADMLPAVHDVGGKILTDESGRIVLRY